MASSEECAVRHALYDASCKPTYPHKLVIVTAQTEDERSYQQDQITTKVLEYHCVKQFDWQISLAREYHVTTQSQESSSTVKLTVEGQNTLSIVLMSKHIMPAKALSLLNGLTHDLKHVNIDIHLSDAQYNNLRIGNCYMCVINGKENTTDSILSVQCTDLTQCPSSSLFTEKSGNMDLNIFLQSTMANPKQSKLLNVTGQILTRDQCNQAVLPDRLWQITKFTPVSSYVRCMVQTTQGHKVVVYSSLASSTYGLVPGFTVQILNLEVSLDAQECQAIFTPITVVEVLKVPQQKFRLIDLSQMSLTPSMQAWDIVSMVGATTPEMFICRARLTRLISVELGIDEQQGKFSAKLMTSMEDGSCEFLGFAYGTVVALLLGINEKEWSALEHYVKKHGTVCASMKAVGEGGIPELLRQLHMKASMSANRQMLLKVLPYTQPEHLTRTVPFRACVDKAKNRWATFKTKIHKTISVKIVSIV